MTDNEIIKALECCNSTERGHCLNKCPYYNYSANCTRSMINDALDLINRKEAEIFKLKEENANLKLKNDEFLKSNEKAQAEIERLKNLVETMSDYFPACINCEGKTPLGERTDKCVYLIDDTEYCTKRGIENIAHIVKENKSQKAEIERLQIRNKTLTEITKNYDWKFAKAKSEAYKEFALDLKCGVPQETGVIRCADVDNTLNELTRNLHGTCTETTDQTATNHSVSLIDGHIEE